MKRLFTLTFSTILSIMMLTTVFADTTVLSDVDVKTFDSNGEQISLKFDSDILNVDGTNFFPLRELLNNLGVDNDNIIWNANEKSVSFTYNTNGYNYETHDYSDNVTYDVKFTVGKNTYTQNGYEYNTVAPFIYENKTYLPIRYTANSLGSTVNYIPETKTTELIPTDYFYNIVNSKDELIQLSLLTEDEVLAKINTNYGTMTARLFPHYAPATVENFVILAEEGFYDGLTFHYVEENSLIQGGDPNGDGTQGTH